MQFTVVEYHVELYSTAQLARCRRKLRSAQLWEHYVQKQLKINKIFPLETSVFSTICCWCENKRIKTILTILVAAYTYSLHIRITTHYTVHMPTQKKDKDRRKGKGRRFCLGGRIYLIPCSPSCFALDNLIYRRNCTRMIWKKRRNSSYSSKSSKRQNSYAASNC